MGRKNIKELSGYVKAGFSFLALVVFGDFVTGRAVIAISDILGFLIYNNPNHNNQIGRAANVTRTTVLI